MSLIVQKFGGTSVATADKFHAAAHRAVATRRQGHDVVLVVSARGKKTDELVALAAEMTDSPQPREIDMLLSTGEQESVALMAMAIHTLGEQAVSLTGGQIGIVTDNSHTRARIREISTDRIRRHLDEGCIVIACGFQGIDDQQNITTLGRGGSDTTATALAAALRADECEIYTDVDGVYTTDPRVVPRARRILEISYDGMLEMASLGAGVMHARSIEFAKKFSVPIHVRSSFTDSPGTLIAGTPAQIEQAVSGAALTYPGQNIVNGLIGLGAVGLAGGLILDPLNVPILLGLLGVAVDKHKSRARHEPEFLQYKPSSASQASEAKLGSFAVGYFGGHVVSVRQLALRCSGGPWGVVGAV